MRAKLAPQGTLDERERALLATPGEGFLRHLEMELKSVLPPGCEYFCPG